MSTNKKKTACLESGMSSLQTTENWLSVLMDTRFCWLYHESVNIIHGILALRNVQTKTGPVKHMMIHEARMLRHFLAVWIWSMNLSLFKGYFWIIIPTLLHLCIYVIHVCYVYIFSWGKSKKRSKGLKTVSFF